MGISIKDLIELAKAGYTPAQVKELISLPTPEEPAKPEEPQKPAGAPTESKPAEPEPEENKAPEKEAEPEKTEEAVDYKALYEKSQSDLKKAQEANRQGSQPEEDPDKTLKDLKETIASYF